MKNYTVVAILTLSCIATSQLHAEGATIGIGAGINDGLKVYLPIKTEQLLIEPGVFLYNSDSDSTSNDYKSNNKYSATEIGVGIYKYMNVMESTFVYYGAKVGYIESEQSYSYSMSTNTSSGSTKQDGYFIAPTIGVEYYLVGNFSIGIDVSLNYSKTDGTESNIYSNFPPSTNSTDIKQTKYNTETEVIVRYYF